MKIDIREITRSFAPKINHDYVRKYFHIDRETNINNDAFFAKMEELTAKLGFRKNRQKLHGKKNRTIY